MDIVEGVRKWDDVYSLGIDLLGVVNPFLVTDAESEGMTWTQIRDLRTYHMGGGRQNYKTSWIRVMMGRYPQSIVVVRDKAARDYFITNWDNSNITLTAMKRSVFTVTDLLTAIAHNTNNIKQVLRECTHVFFDDASRNYMLDNDRFKSVISGMLQDNVVVVMMG